MEKRVTPPLRKMEQGRRLMLPDSTDGVEEATDRVKEVTDEVEVEMDEGEEEMGEVGVEMGETEVAVDVMKRGIYMTKVLRMKNIGRRLKHKRTTRLG